MYGTAFNQNKYCRKEPINVKRINELTTLGKQTLEINPDNTCFTIFNHGAEKAIKYHFY